MAVNDATAESVEAFTSVDLLDRLQSFSAEAVRTTVVRAREKRRGKNR